MPGRRYGPDVSPEFCASRPGYKYIKAHTVKSKKADAKKGTKAHRSYEVGPHCARVQTAWVLMLAEMWTRVQASKQDLTYRETMLMSKKAYAQYKKGHTTSNGGVSINKADIIAACDAAAKRFKL